MENQKRVFHLCRVTSPPELIDVHIIVPGGWIQRRLPKDKVMVRYPGHETRRVANNRAACNETCSEDWPLLTSVEVMRGGYYECLNKQTVRGEVFHDDGKRCNAPQIQESSSSMEREDDDDVLFVNETPAQDTAEDTEHRPKKIKTEDNPPTQLIEETKAPSNTVIARGVAANIVLSSAQTLEFQSPTNRIIFAEEQTQPKIISCTSPGLLTNADINMQQSSNGESADQPAANDSGDPSHAEHISNEIPAVGTSPNDPKDRPICQNNQPEMITKPGLKLINTCRPSKNIQLLQLHDDSVIKSTDNFVITTLPSINIQPTLIINICHQITVDQTENRSNGQGVMPNQQSDNAKNENASKLQETDLDKQSAKEKYQQMMAKYLQYEDKMQEKLKQKRLKIKRDMKKLTAVADKKENVTKDKESEGDKMVEEEDEDEDEDEHDDEQEEDEEKGEDKKYVERQSSKNTEPKQEKKKQDVKPNTTPAKVEKLILKRINPVSLPAEYNKDDSTWTLKYREAREGLQEIPTRSGIYVDFQEFYITLNAASRDRDVKLLARMLLINVFRDEALRVCSLSGKRRVSSTNVKPGLDKHAVDVIIKFAIEHGRNEKWQHVDTQTVLQSLRCKLNSVQRNLEFVLDEQTA